MYLYYYGTELEDILSILLDDYCIIRKEKKHALKELCSNIGIQVAVLGRRRGLYNKMIPVSNSVTIAPGAYVPVL